MKFKKYKRLNKNLKIGYFGSIYKSRGIDILIKLSNEDKNNDYYIYGGSKKEIKNLNTKYSSKNLYFHNYIPYSKIRRKLENVDICLLPYTNKITVSGNVGDISKYTSPLKIFDYMITGKLIICSNIKVIKEVLKHDVNSILVKKKNNHIAWLKEIKKIKSNIKKFNNLRFNAYKFANREDFIWRAKKINLLYLIALRIKFLIEKFLDLISFGILSLLSFNFFILQIPVPSKVNSMLKFV